MSEFDAIIIGTGQAGPSLARRLAGDGARVAIVERGLFGGTCVNTGCTPTKALVASAYAAHLARRGADYGVTIGGSIGIDMKRVKARKDAIVGASSDAVKASLWRSANITVVRGHGRFTSARDIAVGAANMRANRIFINVGGRPTIPPLPGLEKVAYLTSGTILDLDEVPKHLLIVGGIPRSPEDPVILWIDNAEVIRDLVAQGVPVCWNLIAQEIEHRVTEVAERFVALVVGDVPVHKPPQSLNRIEMWAIGRDKM